MPKLTDEFPTIQSKHLAEPEVLEFYPVDSDDDEEEAPPWGSDPVEIIAHRETFLEN